MRWVWFLLLLFCISGCSPSMNSEKLSTLRDWDGTVQQWGTLREVMHGENVTGLLVGFYSDHGAGRITHHWTRTHVHALVGTETELANQRPTAAGHVDAVALVAGSVIRIPQLESPTPPRPNE